jgi:hypothetical protein
VHVCTSGKAAGAHVFPRTRSLDTQAPPADAELAASSMLAQQCPFAKRATGSICRRSLAVAFVLRAWVASVLRAAMLDQRLLLVRYGVLAAAVVGPASSEAAFDRVFLLSTAV